LQDRIGVSIEEYWLWLKGVGCMSKGGGVSPAFPEEFGLRREGEAKDYVEFFLGCNGESVGSGFLS